MHTFIHVYLYTSVCSIRLYICMHMCNVCSTGLYAVVSTNGMQSLRHSNNMSCEWQLALIKSFNMTNLELMKMWLTGLWNHVRSRPTCGLLIKYRWMDLKDFLWGYLDELRFSYFSASYFVWYSASFDMIFWPDLHVCLTFLQTLFWFACNPAVAWPND